MRAVIETVFDIFYLVTVLTVGIRMIRGSKAGTQFRLFGLMAVVLGAGDSFHLVPRALALCTTGLENYAVPLGLGKWITSVTMTVFYVLLYYVWRKRYQIEGQKNVTVAVYALSAVRVVLCMMPQNQWLTNHTPLAWGILRNVPFALLGLLIIVLFYHSARQNLQFLAGIRRKIGKKEIDEAIRKVGLDPEAKKHVGKYSLGMRQRLGIAQAIMEEPSLLILDEPMNGLDNQGVQEMRQLFLKLKEEGKTILLASHNREDIAALCDTTVEIDRGKIVG